MPLNITEYTRLAQGTAGFQPMPVGQEPANAVQDVSIGATSTASSPFSQHTRCVRLVADVDCRIAFGKNPVAGATSTILPAGSVEYFGLDDDGYSVAVVQL